MHTLVLCPGFILNRSCFMLRFYAFDLSLFIIRYCLEIHDLNKVQIHDLNKVLKQCTQKIYVKYHTTGPGWGDTALRCPNFLMLNRKNKQQHQIETNFKSPIFNIFTFLMSERCTNICKKNFWDIYKSIYCARFRNFEKVNTEACYGPRVLHLSKFSRAEKKWRI